MHNDVSKNQIHDKNLIDKAALKPIDWANACQFWTLIDKENMGVFHEKMPPDNSDVLHLHRFSEQFLYVLKGKLGIILDEVLYHLTDFQGILIPKGTPHKVFNDSTQDVEFILLASPNHPDDRVEIPA